MSIRKSKIHRLAFLIYLWFLPFVDLVKLIKVWPRWIKYFHDWRRYRKLAGAEQFKLIDSHPRLHDQSTYTSIDNHYYYQDIWAFQKILDVKPTLHVDVGSLLEFVGYLSVVTKVTFIDIRLPAIKLPNLDIKFGDILNLPLADNSVNSLSCLHVAEHIGLGRYGDKLDPQGTQKACSELARVLAPGGRLYFSLPIGKPRVCFNAHRIHSTKQIFDYFFKLTSLELSAVTDDGKFIENIHPTVLDNSSYACGFFIFTKPI
jgi:SAM-dependent methyltransferase